MLFNSNVWSFTMGFQPLRFLDYKEDKLESKLIYWENTGQLIELTDFVEKNKVDQGRGTKRVWLRQCGQNVPIQTTS